MQNRRISAVAIDMAGYESKAFKISDVKDLVPFIERHGAALAEAIAPGEAAEDLSLAVLRRSDRALTLRHQRSSGRPLDDDSAREVLRHLHRLWKFDVHLESVENGSVISHHSMPPEPAPAGSS